MPNLLKFLKKKWPEKISYNKLAQTHNENSTLLKVSSQVPSTSLPTKTIQNPTTFLAWSDLCRRRHHEEVLMNDLARRKSNFPCNDVWQNVVVLGPQKFSPTVVYRTTQWPYLVWHSLQGGLAGEIIKCFSLLLSIDFSIQALFPREFLKFKIRAPKITKKIRAIMCEVWSKAIHVCTP